MVKTNSDKEVSYLDQLKEKLAKYEEKYQQLRLEWTRSSGGRYGNEFIEMQLKVYEARIVDVKKELLEKKKKK